MNELQVLQILQIAYLFLGLVFGIKTESPEELVKLVLAGLSSLDTTKRDELANASMTVAQGILAGEITEEQIPQYVKLFREKYGLSSPLTAKLGGVLNYINKLNTIR